MEAANHSKNSAMEAENHVKHGASSIKTKNHISMSFLFFASLLFPTDLFAQTTNEGAPFSFLPLILIVLVVFVLIFFAGKNKSNETFTLTPNEQKGVNGVVNKVVNVPLVGGIIGALGSSPMRRLNNAVKDANAEGWSVVNVIESKSGNLFLTIREL